MYMYMWVCTYIYIYIYIYVYASGVIVTARVLMHSSGFEDLEGVEGVWGVG